MHAMPERSLELLLEEMPAWTWSQRQARLQTELDVLLLETLFLSKARPMEACYVTGEASALCLRSGDSRVLRVKSLRARGVTCAVRGRVGRSIVLRDSCGSYGEMTRVVGTRWLVHTGILFLGLSGKTTRLYPSLRLLSVAFGPKKNQIQFSLLVKVSKVSLNLFKDKRIKLKRALRIQTHVRCVLISHAFICFYLFILLWDKNRLAHY